MNELITIIINVYNGEKFISKCLESVINQTYKNLEILIIDDGSDDNTLEICKNYNDARIRIISQNNMGLSLSRNVGIDNAKGEYLFFVDVDDFVERDVVEYLYKMLKKYDVLISTCDTQVIYDYKFKKKDKIEKIELLNSQEMITKILLSIDRSGTIWNKLINKKLFENIRFENRIINDVVVVYKLYLKAKKIAQSNQIKYYYLRHSNSISVEKKENRCEDFYKATLERYNYLKKIYPNYKENEACVCYIIVDLFLINGKSFEHFLKNNKAFELYNKLFNIKILLCKLSVKTKAKMILFRLSPKICKLISDVI